MSLYHTDPYEFLWNYYFERGEDYEEQEEQDSREDFD